MEITTRERRKKVTKKAKTNKQKRQRISERKNKDRKQ